MFNIEGSTIHITRGDIASINIRCETANGVDYQFVAGDVVRFKVMEKKKVDQVKLQKDVTVEETTDVVTIMLSSNDTKIDGLINSPVKYWYEVELNPDTVPQTIIGYDPSGEKLFILYPEGDEL